MEMQLCHVVMCVYRVPLLLQAWDFRSPAEVLSEYLVCVLKRESVLVEVQEENQHITL